MCGRFTMFSDDAELISLFDIDTLEGEHAPAYNQAPSQLIRSVRELPDERRELGLQQWGFVPTWAKEGFKPLINARSETVTSKPVFRGAATRRRCLVPTNGYYEWRKMPDGKKRPYFLSLADSSGNSAAVGSEPLMAMAGIYEDAGEGASNVALLTRAASEPLEFIHKRMPLFLPSSMWGTWMDPNLVDKDEVADLIASVPPPPLAPRVVAPAVGNFRNDFPGLIDPWTPEEGMLPLEGL